MNIKHTELADALVLTTSDSKIISCTSVGIHATYATFVAQPCTGAYNLNNEKTSSNTNFNINVSNPIPGR